MIVLMSEVKVVEVVVLVSVSLSGVVLLCLSEFMVYMNMVVRFVLVIVKVIWLYGFVRLKKVMLRMMVSDVLLEMLRMLGLVMGLCVIVCMVVLVRVSVVLMRRVSIVWGMCLMIVVWVMVLVCLLSVVMMLLIVIVCILKEIDIMYSMRRMIILMIS